MPGSASPMSIAPQATAVPFINSRRVKSPFSMSILLSLQKNLRRFQCLFHLLQKRDRRLSVDVAMVVSEAQVDHRPDDDLLLSDDRLLPDLSHAQNGALGGIDPRREEEGTENPPRAPFW